MPTKIDIKLGRSTFGNDAHGYANGRPDYPVRIYDILREICFAGPQTLAFEIGAGTGQATGPLLALGSKVVAIEPDRRLANVLAEHLRRHGSQLEIHPQTFEDVSLPKSSFDLGVAATSLHWLKADKALRKAFELLQPGGKWAMWWTVFGNTDDPDEFQCRTRELFQDFERSPSQRTHSDKPYALDRCKRVAELKLASFDDINYEEIQWQPTLNKQQVLELTATFSPVARLEPKERVKFLDRISKVVDEDFGGSVKRNFVTAIYTAGRPIS